MSTVLLIKELEKSYKVGRSVVVPAVRGLSLKVERGEFCAIAGPSGSGKTTLLNLIGLLDHPDSGEIWIDDIATSGLTEAQRATIRRKSMGFVFQTFNLLPHLTAEENVALPLRYASGTTKVRHRPADMLARVGLAERVKHRPDEMSGGEQQRVAIARALFLDPPLLLADEPTGDLDSETAAGIIELLDELRREGKTLIVVTHNHELASRGTRLLSVRDGKIIRDERLDRAKGSARPANEEKPKATPPRPANEDKPKATPPRPANEDKANLSEPDPKPAVRNRARDK